MERCEPRARRARARRRRRRRPLDDWQLRDITRVAGQLQAAGCHSVEVHGVLIVFRPPGGVQHAGHGCGHQLVGDAPTASSAKPEQLSKRKQRSSMRLADFRRRMEQRDQAAATKLRRLWSVVWLQRLVRRRLVERSRLAAGEVAPVREPGASAGLQEAKADASEECVAPEGNAATIRAGAVAAPKRKVGSGAGVPPAKAVARLGAFPTSPAARPEAAEAAAAVAAASAASADGAGVPSAMEGKRRVDFSAPVPPSKRVWATLGGGAMGGGGSGGGRRGGRGWRARGRERGEGRDDGRRRR